LLLSGLDERAKRRMAHPFKKQTRKRGAPSVGKLRVLHPPERKKTTGCLRLWLRLAQKVSVAALGAEISGTWKSFAYKGHLKGTL
jgi:hypothetical protein